MPFNEFKTLKVGAYQLKKLVRASDGLILFQTNKSPIPNVASMSTKDYSDVIPTRIVMSQYQSGQFYTSVDSSSRSKQSDRYKFYGSRGSVYLEYYIFFDSNNIPTKIQNYSKVGTQNLNFLPSEGYQITDGDLGNEKIFVFTNPLSDTQTQEVDVVFNSPTSVASELTLDNLDFKDSNGNTILTIGEGFIGYSGNGFTPDPTFDFNQHSGEQFTLTSIDKIRQISFMIG